MNIVFFCHADFASNSMGHIAGFAHALVARGHACATAIPGDDFTSAPALGEPPFALRLFSQTWSGANQLFPDSRPADIIHAWTPREHVRLAVTRYRQEAPQARLFVHLEDNEEHLAACFTGEDFARLGQWTAVELARRLPPYFAHPRHYRTFLAEAHGVTGITDALRDFVPHGIPFLALRPGVDFARFHPGPPDLALRARLGLGPAERLLCYPGNSHFANLADLHRLHAAVRLVNAGGTPCRLLRTGVDTTETRFDADPHVLPLGFVPREQLPALLRLADVLVQPGAADSFNRYRLPSKLPEFLASGRPVLLPRTNLAANLRADEEALFLETGAPEEIAAGCCRVFGDAALAGRLAAGAARAAQRLFNASVAAASLETFYAPGGFSPQMTMFQAR